MKVDRVRHKGTWFLLVHGLPYPKRALVACPGSVLYGDVVVVKDHWRWRRRLEMVGVPELTLPEAYGDDAIANYAWPGPFRPMRHQVETVRFLLRNRRAAVLSDIGTGKTAAAVWAMHLLLEAGDVKRVLVLCPLSTVKSTWGASLFEMLWPVGVRYAECLAPKPKRLKAVASDARVLVSNFHGFPDLAEPLVGRVDLVVVDEATHYRNPQTNAFKDLFRWLSMSEQEGTRLWLMTGTPTPQAPTDAWSLGKMLGNPETPRSFYQARDQLMVKYGPFRWLPRADATRRVAKMLRPSVRHRREDCLDLPETTFQSRDVELTPDQRRAYNDMLKRYVAEVEAGVKVVAVNEAVRTGRLLQIAAGAGYTETEGVLPIDCAPRIKAVLELLEQTDGKMLLFVPYVGVLHLVADEIGKHVPVVKVWGAIPAGKRAEIFSRFQEDLPPREPHFVYGKETFESPRVLCAVPQTMSHGLTLTRAQTVVWYSPTYSGETYTQANGRIERLGKQARSTVVHLVSTALEKEVYRRLEEKRNMQGVLLKLLQSDSTKEAA